jgi:hypothetical protein
MPEPQPATPKQPTVPPPLPDNVRRVAELYTMQGVVSSLKKDTTFDTMLREVPKAVTYITKDLEKGRPLPPPLPGQPVADAASCNLGNRLMTEYKIMAGAANAGSLVDTDNAVNQLRNFEDGCAHLDSGHKNDKQPPRVVPPVNRQPGGNGKQAPQQQQGNIGII